MATTILVIKTKKIVLGAILLVNFSVNNVVSNNEKLSIMNKICILLSLLAFFACKKESIVINDPNYTDLHNTLLEIDQISEQGTAYAEHTLTFDIDKDDIKDVAFTVITSFQTSGPHYTYDGVRIEPLNGFK